MEKSFEAEVKQLEECQICAKHMAETLPVVLPNVQHETGKMVSELQQRLRGVHGVVTWLQSSAFSFDELLPLATLAALRHQTTHGSRGAG